MSRDFFAAHAALDGSELMPAGLYIPREDAATVSSPVANATDDDEYEGEDGDVGPRPPYYTPAEGSADED